MSIVLSSAQDRLHRLTTMSQRSLTAFILFAVSVLSDSASNAQTTATGPTQQTGPSVSSPTATSSKVDQQLSKVRIDPTGLSPKEFVEKLLAEMTFAEKLGQMQQIYPGGEILDENQAEAIAAGNAGSIFFVGHEQQIRDAQRTAVEESRLGIPLIVARDVIHGFRTAFPIPVGQAASWNPELVQRAAEVAASESRRVGIHWTFAPMVDVTRDPRWGRIAESCGEDPVLASAMGAAMVKGFQSTNANGKITGIAACPKHYVGYGLAEGGRDYNRALVSRNELRNVFLPPFKACVDAGAATIMSAFNSVNGIPATGNRRLLRGVLKDEWKFPGFVVSDWGSVTEMQYHGFAADKREAAIYALRAGLDMEMVTTCFNENLKELVDSNVVSIEMIDDAVRRILLAKVRLNLFTDPYADATQPELLSKSHLQVARELAQQSAVLLKNTGVLPLERTTLRKVAVIGPFADAGKDQIGTWAMDSKAEDSITPLTALKMALGDNVQVTYIACDNLKYGESPEQVAAAVDAANDADVVLLFVGEEEALSGEAHSRADLSFPGGQGELVLAIAQLDVPVVMTVLAGRPLTIGSEIDAVDAVLYAWQGGTMAGPAIADLLLGEVSPSGKLPVSFPKSVGQIPLYYNHPNTGRPAPADYQPPPLAEVGAMHHLKRYTSHYVDLDPFPRFLFGFGLTYTDFEYYDLKLGSSSITEDESLKVSVRLANVGSRPAVETVQLYTRDFVASVVRPVKELKLFRRVMVEPGTTKVVKFELPRSALGFFNEQEQYVVEPGEFEVSVGGSSNTPLSAKFSLE